jgi:nicotinate dehydrogenase subunit B
MSRILGLKPSRRQFLQGMGGLLVAVSLPVTLEQQTVLAQSSGPFGPLTVPPNLIDSWLAVGKDGLVTIYTGKVELGTGTLTATRQIVAEELDVAYASTRIIQAITGETVDQTYTAGSQTIRTQWASGLRIAAASARQQLLQMAAARLRVPIDQLTVEQGVVREPGGRSVTYAQLVGGAKLPGTVNPGVMTKAPSTFTIVGKSLPREDIPAKVFGTFTYVQDVRVPGMLHGRVVRPMRPSPLASSPTALAAVATGTIVNGTVASIDEASVRHLPGHVRVVRVQNFVGVVADREEQAIAAAQALKVEWNDPADLPDQASLEQILLSTPPDNTRTLALTGDVDGVIGQSAKTLQATYSYPYQLHGSIGPSCAVASVHDGVAEIWSGTQGVYQLRDAVAGLLNLPPENVRVTYVEGSGCYGLNGADDVSLSAALLSQAVGRPVRVQYMRGDEMAWENFGTPMVMTVRAGLDESGHITAWDYKSWTENRGSRPPPAGNLPAGVLAGQPEKPPPPSPPPGTPPLGDDGSNAYPWYSFPAQRVISYGLYRKWLFTGPLRSPSRIQNTFAQESFMDELAAAAGADPIAFRLAHTSDPRLIAVIKRAAQAAGWQTRPSPNPSQQGTVRTGRGIAAVRYEGSSSWVAGIITVQVHTGTGVVTPTQIVIAHDCGVIINPDGLRNQIQGNIVQGISRSLKEEVTFDRSGVRSVDWNSYPIVRFADLPEDVRIELIDRPDLPALGAGEASISVIPAAFANAIFDATGKRLRQVPFTPARVKAAVQA